MRALLLLLLPLCLTACAGPGLAPADSVDPAARAGQLVQGFQEAAPGLEQLVDRAAAWAVFEGVEDRAGPCEHQGQLFVPGREPRDVQLRCRPFTAQAPGGQTYHLLVVLGSAVQLERLETDPLDLAGAEELALSSSGELRRPLAPTASDRWLVTTARDSLLFEAARLSDRLELVLTGP